MTEFQYGAFKFLKQQLYHSSMARAVVYTIGHIFIAATCNYLITGAEFHLATVDAIVEPIVNGVWYYVLDKMWTRKLYSQEDLNAK
tara:strand:+ start:308 stop:565 length:258 start_codon:yes stop_codon:yes gene_type:complete